MGTSDNAPAAHYVHPSESASRPPSGFWMNDDKYLED
jgi:hypothetical protein